MSHSFRISSVLPGSYRFSTVPPILCGLGLLLYFLFPYTIPQLGFSPHLLFFIPAFLFLLPCLFQKPATTEAILVSLVALFVLGSFVFAPMKPDLIIVRGWIFTLLVFWVCRQTFSKLSQLHIEISAQFVLLLYSITSLAQAYFPPHLFGDGAYISMCFGQKVGTHYAVGLTSFTNQAAALMLPLLMYTLAANVRAMTFWRSVLWILSCSAFYLTLSRAGWLAFIIILSAYGFMQRNDKARRMRVMLHLIAGLCAAFITWSIPSPTVSNYAPGGDRAIRWDVDEDMKPTDFSLSTRIVTLQVTLHSILAAPLTGIGLGAFPLAYRSYIEETHPEIKERANNGTIDSRYEMTPHNAYAQFAAELGLPAFFALMSYLLYLLIRIVRGGTRDARALATVLVGMAVYLCFHDGFIDRQFWLMLGCGLALSKDQQKATA